jgi:arylsulfatase A-like enzyme
MTARTGGSSRKTGTAWRVVALGLAVLACGSEPVGVPPERIVLVVIDTLRADALSSYGGEAQTPNTEALATRGTLFRHVHASFHQTTMSMASLFTGRTPSLETGDVERTLAWTSYNWCGLSRLATKRDAPCVPDDTPTLAEKLRDAGYTTAAVVTNALLFRPAGYDRGYDHWIEVGSASEEGFVLGMGNPRARNAARAHAALARLLPELLGHRLFLYVHYMDVHDYALAGRSYREAVERTDRALGELLRMLDAHGLLEGATLILTSDHGERLDEPHLVEGRHSHFGNPSFEEVLRVPLVVVPPIAGDPDLPLRGDDIHRLILHVAGLESSTPADLEPGELFLSEMHWQTYRRGRFKSYRPRDDPEALRLVDLAEDPGELRDVAGTHPEIAGVHARRLDALTGGLAASERGSVQLSEEDVRRLRALGYLEPDEPVERDEPGAP